ncbi:hypothetical protein Ancab_019343 [Ancistrocladus abbreviatus]
MPDSRIEDFPSHDTKPQNRLCDFCGESVALLYCRADSAKLCLACDREVHFTNQLFTKHTRSQLCDACDSSPASIYCSTERSVLCQNCDYELHDSLKISNPIHDRRPLEGFTGCPSVCQLTTFVGLENFDVKSLLLSDDCEDLGGGFFGGCEENDGISDLLVWDTPAIINIDELIVSTDHRSHNIQALGVPPLPKDRNWTCGQYKQEILRQLRHLGKSEPNLNLETEVVPGNQLVVQEDHFGVNDVHGGRCLDTEPIQFLGNEASSYPWCSDVAIDTANETLLSSALLEVYHEESSLMSDRNSAAGICVSISGNGQHAEKANVTESLGLPPKAPGHEFITVDRDSALSRYKEKKRSRRYEKHIRYESRKALAEGRTRIKGRFAKIDRCVPQSRPPQ